MAKFCMEEWEILEAYRTAKNKREQVGILADRNCCSKKDIAEFLKSQGEDVKVPYQYKRLDTSDCKIVIEALVHYKHTVENELKVVSDAQDALLTKLHHIEEKINIFKEC